MVLVIDNYDSFTYNLVQQAEALGHRVQVVAHDEVTAAEVEAMAPERIIVSPGPKGPADAGVSRAVIRRLYQRTPILGVCLGHQCIGDVFGVPVVHAPQVVHGATSAVSHDGQGIFRALPSPIDAARYHSLVLGAVPRDFELAAWTSDGVIMAIRHRRYPLTGVQFHPESFMTQYGEQMMKSFLS